MTERKPLHWDTSAAPSAFDPEDWLSYRERASGRSRPRLPDVAVQTVAPAVWDAALTRSDVDPDDFTDAGHPFLTLANGRAAVALSGKGSYAAGGLDELFALGVLAVVSIGGCGTLTGDVGVGTVVIPHDALADDGVAFHYVGPQQFVAADGLLTSLLIETATGRGLPAREGRVWTTSAHFRQALPRLEAFRSDGCIAVDNESAGAFAVGLHRHRSVARLLVVGDSIANGRFDVPVDAQLPAAALLLDVAVEALERWQVRRGDVA